MMRSQEALHLPPRRAGAVTTYLGVCPNPKCTVPHPPIVRTYQQLQEVAGYVPCGCGTPHIFIMKRGDDVATLDNGFKELFVFICTREGTKCAPRFRPTYDPPRCRHNIPMHLVIGKRR